jgi:hypothetical protein
MVRQNVVGVLLQLRQVLSVDFGLRVLVPQRRSDRFI